MIVKANQIELTKEIVEKHLELVNDIEYRKGRKRLKEACKPDNDTIIIDWSGCTVDELNLDVITQSMYFDIVPEFFNNKYILAHLVEKFAEDDGTQLFWDFLVDSGGPLSHETFCSLSYLEIITEYLKYKKTMMDDFTDLTGLQYEYRKTDVLDKVNKLLINNDMPELGTSEFNELCNQYFGGSN